MVAQVVGKGQVGESDFVEKLLAIVAVKRRKPCEHLVQQGPERPPVDRPAVALAVQDLRREVPCGRGRGGEGGESPRTDALQHFTPNGRHTYSGVPQNE